MPETVDDRLLRKLAEVYDRIEIDPSPIRNKINEIIGQFKKKFDDIQMYTFDTVFSR